MMVPSRHARQRERLSSASSKASTIATAYTRQSVTSRQTTRNRSQRPRKVEPVSTKTGEGHAWQFFVQANEGESSALDKRLLGPFAPAPRLTSMRRSSNAVLG